MPKSALDKAMGIEITISHKTGFGFFSYTKTKGMVFARNLVDRDSGGRDGIIGPSGLYTPKWSPPIFTKGFSFGIGFSVGTEILCRCNVLLNEEALKERLRRVDSFGAAVNTLVDMNGSRLRKCQVTSAGDSQPVINEPNGGSYARYYIVEALLVEAAFRFIRKRPWKALNDDLYGPYIAPGDILAGKVDQPPQMKVFYDLLQQYEPPPPTMASTTQAGKVMRPRGDRSTRGLRMTASRMSIPRMLSDQVVGDGGGSNDGSRRRSEGNMSESTDGGGGGVQQQPSPPTSPPPVAAAAAATNKIPTSSLSMQLSKQFEEWEQPVYVSRNPTA
jgi:hypothetical protein